MSNHSRGNTTSIIALLVCIILLLGFFIIRQRRAIHRPTPTPIQTINPTASPTATQTPQSSFSEHSIGYIGCSNSMQSVQGYQHISTKHLLWNDYATGGMSIEKWADPRNAIWKAYDQQVKRYGQPKAVWVQLCEHEERPVTYAAVQNMIANLKTHSPNALYYISPLNMYDPPTLCSFMGSDGTDDIVAFVNQAIQDGLGERGPIVGPLTASNTKQDRCHLNPEGQTLIGGQLKDFFDSL